MANKIADAFRRVKSDMTSLNVKVSNLERELGNLREAFNLSQTSKFIKKAKK